MNRAIDRHLILTRPLTRCCHCSSVQKHELDPLDRLSKPISSTPDHQSFEPFWYRYWEEKKLLKSSASTKGPTFAMMLPPPNITGDLHLGHALTVTLQDAFLRYHRMKGYLTAWTPGFDHAGIATQLILEKLAQKQKGISTRDMTPEQFDEFANQWKEQRMKEMRTQLKKLGACLDFDQEFFTLSPQISDAVRTAFIKLFNDGLIYRKKRIVNWSYFLKSTLSDYEVDWLHVNGPTRIQVPGFSEPVEFGLLHKFSYPLANDMSGKSVTVATTRIETMIADVAVAVNPEDERYRDMIGRELFHPLTGAKIPVIADEKIEKTFGTGAMKLTPSHSQTDYEIAVRHNLPLGHEIFDEEGNISCPDLRSQYQVLSGLHRFAAKDKIVEMLKHAGLYRGSEPLNTRVPLCARSGDVIEAVPKDQWYVNLKEATAQLRKDIESGKIRVNPENYKQVWLKQWMNPRQDPDWCISRQIKWGHRIPAFRVTIDGQASDRWVAAKSAEEAMRKLPQDVLASGSEVLLLQDNDVLDTWFSSSLLPFSVLGWPDVDPNPLSRYPLSLMETGYDILGLWVHRMALMSKILTGNYAFERVFLHGMLCDANGKKMTKSLGNVIDPLDVIRGISLTELWAKSDALHESGLLSQKDLEKAKQGQSALMPDGIPSCGADGLRLSLIQENVKAQAVRIGVRDITRNRRLMNKMWNAYKFFERITEHYEGDWWTESHLKKKQLSHVDRWILSRTSHLVQNANNCMESGDVHLLYKSFHRFWINELCDVYIEHVKSNSAQEEGRSERLNVLKTCLETALRCLHPVIPFITEELFQRVNFKKSPQFVSILQTPFPDGKWWQSFADPELDQSMRDQREALREKRRKEKESRCGKKM